MTQQTSFIEELKRRNVVRVGVVYLIAAWLLAQVADLMLENFHAPEWVIQAILVVLIIGFPVALIFAWAFELTPEGIKKERDVDRSQSITNKTGHKLDRSIIAILVVALGYFVWESRFNETPDVTPDHAQRESGARTASSETAAGQVNQTSSKSIAVLPFVNMSSDPEQEYFSDGISEEILNALAKVKDLKVAGRTSSFAFKGKEQDLRQVGEMLGVEHILEGSVRKSGATVRITAQLIQVEDGFHLWSETYDRELTDVFAIQDEISNAILVQLKATLLGEEQSAVTAATTDPEVYDLYLMARQRMYERTRLTLESAAELLDEAIALDPAYAPAYAQRGIATMLLSDENYGTIPKEQAEAQGKLYLDKALSLDSNQAEAWAGLGLYHTNRNGEHGQAIETLEKALSINPSLIDASNWLQIALTYTGDDLAALEIVEKMIERDPLYKPGIGNAINLYNNFGMSEKSWALIEQVRPFMPNEPNVLQWQGGIHLYEGHPSMAFPLLEKAWRQQPDNTVFQDYMSLGLVRLHEYQQVADVGSAWARVIALTELEREEEAFLLALEEAKGGNIGSLFRFLAQTGRTDELITFLEDRWHGLENFEAEYPADSIGYGLMLNIAFAYARSGKQEQFDDAMARIRAAHDRSQAIGIKHFRFSMHEAAYYALAGDHESALEQLALSVDAGYIVSSRLVDRRPEFEVMEGDPRYEAIQNRMIEHLNSERSALGLEAVTI